MESLLIDSVHGSCPKQGEIPDFSLKMRLLFEAINRFNPIWTGFFANLKEVGYFKLEDDETWYTMGRIIYKLTKKIDDVIVMLIL